MKLGDLFIKLGLKSEQFEQGVDKAKGSLSGFGTLAKTVGGMLVAAFSVRAIVSFFTTSVKLANEQIAVENQLAAALKANGQNIEENLSRYKRFASEIQRITTVGDETTLSLIRLAVTMQSKAPEEAAKMAIGLSKALGMDLQTATRAAVLAQNGNTIALSRYIPGVRSATTEAGKLAAVQEVVASGMQIATAETETMEGKVQQLRNTWGDFRETIGTVIATNDTLLQSLTDLNTAVQMLSTKKFGFTSFLAFLGGGKSWEADKKRFEESMRIQKLANEAIDEYEKNIKGARATVDEGAATQKKYGRTIGEIEQEITELKETLSGYGEYQTAEIQKTLAQIKANEELIKTLTTLNETKKRQTATAPPAMQTGRQATGTLTPRESYAGLMREAPVLDTSQLDDMTAYMQNNIDLVNQYEAELLSDFNRFKEDSARLVADFGTDVVEQFGSAIGNLLASGGLPSDFGSNILASIGQFISTLGKMLIGLGIASEAFQNLLKSAFTSPGAAIAAIAAGAALVALGGAISSYARAKASGGSGGGSGSASGQPGVYSTGAMGSFQLGALSTTIRGNEMSLMINREQRRNTAIG